jgi:hypothetical protein
MDWALFAVYALLIAEFVVALRHSYRVDKEEQRVRGEELLKKLSQ